MKWKGIIAITIVCLLLLGSIIFVINLNDEKETPPEREFVPIADDMNATAESVITLVDAMNDFSFDFYSQIKSEEGNVFFSPYSIFVALSMAYEGARENETE